MDFTIYLENTELLNLWLCDIDFLLRSAGIPILGYLKISQIIIIYGIIKTRPVLVDFLKLIGVSTPSFKLFNVSITLNNEISIATWELENSCSSCGFSTHLKSDIALCSTTICTFSKWFKS